MRLAKARARHLGLRWPPIQPVLFRSYLAIHHFKVAAWLPLHNFGLCVLPNVMELVLRFIYTVLGKAAFDHWLVRGDEWWRENMRSYACLKGRCKMGFSRLLRRKARPPALRSKSRYDIVHAFKGFALLVHETLREIARDADAAAARADQAEEDARVEANRARSQANRARLSIRAIQVTADLGHLLALKMPAESDRMKERDVALQLMPLVKTAFRDLKDFNRSTNWHKLRHPAELLQYLGPLYGGLNDQHGELCQKLLHLAYQCFSSKTSSVLPQLADYFSRHAAMNHAQSWLSSSNADLVDAARLGITSYVEFLLFADPAARSHTVGRAQLASRDGVSRGFCDPLGKEVRAAPCVPACARPHLGLCVPGAIRPRDAILARSRRRSVARGLTPWRRRATWGTATLRGSCSTPRWIPAGATPMGAPISSRPARA